MKRPWGSAQKIIPRLGEESWGFIGCSSFEDRCIGASNIIHNRINQALCLRLDDGASRFTTQIDQKTNANDTTFNNLYQNRISLQRYRLLGPISDIVSDIKNLLARSAGRLIIDMSCLPKRILCLALKEALRDENLRDLLVTYTVPISYTEEPLAEDLNPLSAFPGFSPDLGIDEPKRIIASLGYTPFDLAGLQQQLGGRPLVSTLFPFPPGAPRYQRNWQLLLKLFGVGEAMETPIRVDAIDVSYAFDVLKSLTNSGQEHAFLLPFGPKPHSLAMLLHSIQFKSVVQYTQPKIYHPEYSSGIKKINEDPVVYCYCIRLQGQDLYI